MPLLYLTLELPKRIINEAIASPSDVINAYGYDIPQITYLMILCGLFLLSVTAHGLLKMRVNTMKGVLAERMLRRLRYSLIARMLRFPAPYFERTSQGEIVSMVSAEAEPMGGLMGNALSQPVQQAGQMLTILAFLFMQSVTFGLAAIALIPLQAWLIPKLQRQINKLNKKRVIQVRALAAEIGEGAAGASALRVSGGWRYRMAMITDRLNRLFWIRFEIYKKKFFMKFLNNFINQITPFFFYSVGGYLVITGDVTLGALVAGLTAYKDIASPWKELLAYYNQVADMSLRWETVVERFAPQGMVDEKLFDGLPDTEEQLRGDIVFERMTVRDSDGNPVLDGLNQTFAGQSVIGITAPSDEDRRALAGVLTREMVPSSGSITIGGNVLSDVHQATIAAKIGHATSRPVMFQGSFGDNVLLPLKRQPLAEPGDAAWRTEAARSGNAVESPEVEWIDPSVAQLEDAADLRAWWFQLAEGMGSGTALFRRALDQTFDAEAHPDVSDQLVALRPKIKAALEEAALWRWVYPFEESNYNPALPVAENLVFATPRLPVTATLLAEQTDFLDQLRALGLDDTLLNVAENVVDLLRQIFGTDGTDHPLFQKLGLDHDIYQAALDLPAKRAAGKRFEAEEIAALLSVPMRLSAEIIGPAFGDDIKDRILDIRRQHGAALRGALDPLFVPLDAQEPCAGLTVLENMLYGKISDGAGSRGEDIRRIVAQVIIDAGLGQDVLTLIFDVPISLGGSNLPALLAETLAISRATIKRPDILVLQDCLASFEPSAQTTMVENLRRLLPETTFIVIRDQFEDTSVFDTHLEMEGGQFVGAEAPQDKTEADSAASADLARKVAALGQTAMFSGLDRKQLRLLGFGSRWYTAQDGEYVFHKNDAPDDGAYMIISGEADLLLPQDDGEDKLIATVGTGTLVGELGLIRGEPRALDMRAKGELQCLRLGVEEFMAVVENDAATAYKMLQVVAGYVNT